MYLFNSLFLGVTFKYLTSLHLKGHVYETWFPFRNFDIIVRFRLITFMYTFMSSWFSKFPNIFGISHITFDNSRWGEEVVDGFCLWVCAGEVLYNYALNILKDIQPLAMASLGLITHGHIHEQKLGPSWFPTLYPLSYDYFEL